MLQICKIVMFAIVKVVIFYSSNHKHLVVTQNYAVSIHQLHGGREGGGGGGGEFHVMKLSQNSIQIHSITYYNCFHVKKLSQNSKIFVCIVTVCNLTLNSNGTNTRMVTCRFPD